jgi:3-oxoacyl-[acyl-carrier-protein] synthase-3
MSYFAPITTRLAGCGHYVPARRVLNREIEARLRLTGGWIEERTGIRSRHYAAAEEATSDLAVKAAEDLFARNPGKRNGIGLLVLATSTPDHLLPPTAPLVAYRLGLTHTGAMDLAGACSGFVQALVLADGFVRAQERPALVIAANVLSRRLDPNDRGSTVLFADAAGAVLLEPSQDPTAGLMAADLNSEGTGYGFVSIPAGGSRKPFAQASAPNDVLMRMNDGGAMFQRAIELMVGCAEAVLKKSHLAASDISRFVPHQANARMTAVVARRLGVTPEAMLSSVEDYGNSSAATIPLTLSLSTRDRPLKPGEHLLFTAAGAGLTAGAALLRV